MYCETWHKLWCIKCNAVNWLGLGNLDDCTRPDPDGVKCRVCGFIEYYEEDILRSMHEEELKNGESLEEVSYVWIGEETPH